MAKEELEDVADTSKTVLVWRTGNAYTDIWW